MWELNLNPAISTTIFCILASSSTTFPVDIEMTLTVSHSKEDTKKRKPNKLDIYDAHAFTLYRIDQGNETEINPMHKLSKVLGPSAPPEAEEMAPKVVD